MTMISAAPIYRPTPVPADYDGGWLSTQLANIARAIFPRSTRTLKAAGTMKATDDLVVCDATAGAFAYKLLPANQVQDARVTIKKTDASANAITITGTVDGVVNPTLAARYNAMTIHCDGTSFHKIASV